MPTNDFKAFACGAGANVISQSDYVANAALIANGFESGIAFSDELNKVWRQSSIISTMIASYIQQATGLDVIDDGTIATIQANFSTALSVKSYGLDTSAVTNIITANLNPAPTALSDGMVVTIKPAITNTGPALMDINGIGIYPVVNSNGALVGGEYIAHQPYMFAWIAATSSWFLMTGNQLRAVTQTPGNNSTLISTTAYADYAALHAGFQSGTRLLFAQATAPVGWTQDVSDSANNRMSLVVNDTTGNSVGGTYDPKINNVVASHTHAFTTATQNANHSHTDSGHSHTYGYRGGTQPQSGSATQCWWAYSTQVTGVGYAVISTETATHAHTGSTDNGSSQTNWTPRYLKQILCQKD